MQFAHALVRLVGELGTCSTCVLVRAFDGGAITSVDGRDIGTGTCLGPIGMSTKRPRLQDFARCCERAYHQDAAPRGS